MTAPGRCRDDGAGRGLDAGGAPHGGAGRSSHCRDEDVHRVRSKVPERQRGRGRRCIGSRVAASQVRKELGETVLGAPPGHRDTIAFEDKFTRSKIDDRHVRRAIVPDCELTESRAAFDPTAYGRSRFSLDFEFSDGTCLS